MKFLVLLELIGIGALSVLHRAQVFPDDVSTKSSLHYERQSKVASEFSNLLKHAVTGH